MTISGASIALMTESGPAGTVAVSDTSAATLEDLQFSLGEGPCIDSSRSGRPVLVPDLARTGPGAWPQFSAGALDAGVRAVFAFPLRVGGIRVGVLDLYRDAVGVLGDSQLEEALSFADAATVVLLHLQSEAAFTGVELAATVLGERAEVHQATGVVSVQAGVPLASALVLLRARAYASERPLLDLARDVLAGSARFEREADGSIHGP